MASAAFNEMTEKSGADHLSQIVSNCFSRDSGIELKNARKKKQCDVILTSTPAQLGDTCFAA
jgi:hypothetical protein